MTRDNRAVYETADAVRAYARRRPAQAGELATFEPLKAELASARLLDIGIGGGRTTAYLGPMVRDYVGIDYSQTLIDVAAEEFPEYTIAWGDARDLSDYADCSFDVVNFSFNGIDSINHPGRRRVLEEVHRVLGSRGRFFFSSHNRDYRRLGMLPWQGRFRPGRVMLKKSWEAARAHRSWRHLRPLQESHEEYALVNDEAHEYSLLHYYISPPRQIAQLEAHGFTDVEVRDQTGEPSSHSPDSVWMYYSSRKG